MMARLIQTLLFFVPIVLCGGSVAAEEATSEEAASEADGGDRDGDSRSSEGAPADEVAATAGDADAAENDEPDEASGEGETAAGEGATTEGEAPAGSEAEAAGGADAEEAGASAGGEADAGEEPPRLPSVSGVPGEHLDVSFVRAVDGVERGESLRPGRELALSDGSCLRLVAESAASFGFSGPSRLALRERSGRVVVAVEAGRGVVAVGEEAAALEIGSRTLVLREAVVTFDTTSAPAATLVTGEAAALDGAPLAAVETREDAVAAELLAADWCSPPRPRLALSLGDPESLMADVEQTRRAAASSDDEGATAESGATCVDSADSASASSPNTGDGVVIDPDVRQENAGTLRLTIRVPSE